MAKRVYHYRWDWYLKASPEELWPLVADTNRFNLDTGLPPVQQVPGTGRQPNARRRLFFHQLGIRIEWDEEPFEWVRPFDADALLWLNVSITTVGTGI